MHTRNRTGRELRLAGRGLARARGFAAPALFALAVGIGGGAAILSLVDAGLSHPSPVESTRGVAVPGSRGESTATIRFSPLQRFLGAGQGLQDAAMEMDAIQAASLRELLRTLGAVAGLTLLVAGLNLSLLLLMRASARRREMAIRAALGASRSDLLRQLGAEGLVLAIAGAVLGLIVAGCGVWLVRGAWAPGLVPWLADPVPVRAVATAVGLLVIAAVLGSLAPAAGAVRRPLQPDLAAGDRATSDPREVGHRRRLGIAAVAGSVVLLVGAGVLVRGFSAGGPRAEPVFDASDTLTLHLAVHGTAGAGAGQGGPEIEALLDAISAVPGVTAASISSPGAWIGLGTRDIAHALLGPPGAAGSMLPPGRMQPATFHSVAPGYFTAMGIPVVTGRDLAPADREGAPGALVVNESFVRSLLLGLDPLGKKVQLGGISLKAGFYTVVGVVPDARLPGLGVPATPQPAVYLSALQVPPTDIALAVRTTGDPLAALPAVEAAVSALRTYSLIDRPATMEDRIARFAAPIRWFGGLFTVAALLAALLAARGLHGVIAYSVLRQRREIGVRMAMGAPPSAIVRRVVRESARLTAVGGILGLAGALCLARLLEYLFHGVDALDPAVYGAVAALLGLIAVAASVGPARTAARLHPVAALREE